MSDHGSPTSLHPGRTFINTEAFYEDDPARRTSGELDFGCWWAGSYDFPRYRISLVLDTGELYAVCLSDGPVELLGVFGSRDACERALEGWADVCGLGRSLEWARRRAREGAPPRDRGNPS